MEVEIGYGTLIGKKTTAQEEEQVLSFLPVGAEGGRSAAEIVGGTGLSYYLVYNVLYRGMNAGRVGRVRSTRRRTPYIYFRYGAGRAAGTGEGAAGTGR